MVGVRKSVFPNFEPHSHILFAWNYRPSALFRLIGCLVRILLAKLTLSPKYSIQWLVVELKFQNKSCPNLGKGV